MSSAILTRNSNLVNKSLFFRNNLSQHVNSSGELSAHVKPINAVAKADSKFRQLHNLIHLFRNTGNVKRLTIHARKLRTFISLIPKDLFFKAGIIRISSTLQQLDNLTNTSRIRQVTYTNRG